MRILTWVARATGLIAVAAGIYLAATDNKPLAAWLPEPVQMYGGVRTAHDTTAPVMDAINTALQNKQARIHLVVQFRRILSIREETQLETRHNIDILEAVPENAYVIAFPTSRAFSILEQLKQAKPPRGAVMIVRPGDKLSPRLGTPDTITLPDHARLGDDAAVIVQFFADVSDNDQENTLEQNKADLEIFSSPGQGRDNQWQVVLPVDYLKKLLQDDSLRWVEAVPRPPVDDMNEVREVAGYSVAPLSTTATANANAGAGAGVKIAQWENCQPDAAHHGLMSQGMTERIVAANVASSSCSADHATMVAGIYMGNGNGVKCVIEPGVFGIKTGTSDCRPDDFQGMAALANARAYAYAVADLPLLKFYYNDAMAAGAMISQNSWGEPCDIYSNPGGSFNPTNALIPFHSSGSVLFDTVVSGRDSFGQASGYPGRMLVVTSVGNYGDEVNIPSLWGSARVTNSAKNVLTVGSVNTPPTTQSTTQTRPWAHLHSGRGPTADGRLAPVLSAPGIRFNNPDAPYTLGTPNHPNNGEPEIHGIRTTYPGGTTNPGGIYKASWGTSFATPVVSGAAALLTESYRNVCSADPSPMELRALLIHTAYDLKEAYSSFNDVPNSLIYAKKPINMTCNLDPTYASPYSGYKVRQGAVYEGPDYIFGYGLVQADAAREFARRSNFTTGEISSGFVEYKVNVDSSSLEDGRLRVTLVWDDPPWPINAPPSPTYGFLQNDLDLELIDPSGKLHLPWVLDPENPAAPAKQHSPRFRPITAALRDHRNTIEQVDIKSPEPGPWKIRVRAGRLLRPAQSFTLVSKSITPAHACGDLPSVTVKKPIELPTTWLFWWLFWLAVIILILLTVELLRLIWKAYGSQQGLNSPWVHSIAAVLLLFVVFALLYLFLLKVLGVLLLVLLILSFWLS